MLSPEVQTSATASSETQTGAEAGAWPKAAESLVWPPVVSGDAGLTGPRGTDGSTTPPQLSLRPPGPTQKGTKVTAQTPHCQTCHFIPKRVTLGALAGFANTYPGAPSSAPGADGAVSWWKMGMGSKV